VDKFIDELSLLLEWTQANSDIDNFEKEFSELVEKYRREEDVLDIANIVAHNYNCHIYNNKKAIIHTIDQWKEYKKEC